MASASHPRTMVDSLRPIVCFVGLLLAPGALASSPAEPPPGDLLQAFMARTGTVGSEVTRLVGAATEPEADASAFAEALARYEAQRARIEKRLPVIQKALRHTIDDARGTLPRRQRLLRRLDAHLPLHGAVEGASLRRGAHNGLRGPLAGGQELGPVFHALGRLMGAQIIDDIARRRRAKVGPGIVRLARFGALVADSAQTLDELASGLRAAREAVGLFHRFPDLARATIGEATVQAVREARENLSEFARSLQVLSKALRAPGTLQPFVALAATCPRPLCRYEAVKVLRRAAWSAPGTPRGARAEQLLEEVAGHPEAPDAVKEAARRAVTSLRVSR